MSPKLRVVLIDVLSIVFPVVSLFYAILSILVRLPPSRLKLFIPTYLFSPTFAIPRPYVSP